MSENFLLHSPVDVYGAFWRPEEPDKTITGRLSRDGKFLLLTTSPVYKQALDLPTDFLSANKQERVDILHGFTTEGPCSLLALQSPNEGGLTNFELGKALTFRQYRVGLCIFGLLPPTPSSNFFAEAMFGFSGLHEWLPVLPRKARTDKGNWTISYPEKPPFVDFCFLPLKTRLQLDIIPVMHHSRTGELQSKHHSQFLVEPVEPKGVEWYLDLAYRLENLFSLLLGTSIRLETVRLKANGTIGSVLRADRSKKQPTDISVWTQCTASQLATAIIRWLSQPEEFGSLEGLVYGTIRRSSLFVETEFLSLAQALESFHRVSSGTNMTFANRIKALLASVSDQHRKQLIGDDIQQFVDTLRDTRNYFTHVGGEKKSGVLRGMSELFLFSQKLHALLRLLMLIHIGLPEDQVFEKVLHQSKKWSSW